MSSKQYSLSSYPFNSENPFLNQAVEKINNNVAIKYQNATRTGEKAILHAVDPNSGEVLGTTSFVRYKEVDQESFIKIYLTEFRQFFDLSTAGIRVFGYVIENLLPGQDKVLINIAKMKEYTHYSTSTIYRGLSELLSANIVARGYNTGFLYVNPMCIFNGDRINYIKTVVRKRKNEIPPEQNSIPFPLDETIVQE